MNQKNMDDRKPEEKTQVTIKLVGTRMDQDTHEKYTKIVLCANGICKEFEIREGSSRIYVF